MGCKSPVRESNHCRDDRVNQVLAEGKGVSARRGLEEAGAQSYEPSIPEYYRVIPEIDGWIRRRIRLCYWKQWRYCRTKVRNLLALGTQLGTAIRAGMSRSGPWGMSRRLAAQSGMTNKSLRNKVYCLSKNCG